MNGELLIERLIAYAKAFLHLQACDEIYTRNLLLSKFGLFAPYDGNAETRDVYEMRVPDALYAEICAFARERGLCDAGEEARFAAGIFGLLTPPPSEVNRAFYAIKAEKGAQCACDYLYGLSVRNGYIQKTAIEKNLVWTYDDGQNTLEITVNLSKPEKNNKDIAKLLTAPQSKGYPACALCKENEGFEGQGAQAPRQNIRTVKTILGGEPWFVQYSPYAYYDEHCIAISEAHTPMNVNDSTVEKVLDFVDAFPNYFIGSNASLPIIGGSILNHEHFQGGRHEMPMHRAEFDVLYEEPAFPDVRAGILDWYNSAFQLESENRASVAALAKRLIAAWKKFDCPACNVLSHSGDTPHNSCSPIARRVGGKYVVTLIFRNNRADEQFPDGIFHVHPRYHNIKSEGIGLIEAMGLFILPGRLKAQLEEITDIVAGAPYDASAPEENTHPLYLHRGMIKDLLQEGTAANRETAHERVISYVNRVCAGILDCTAVFKRDETGRRGFDEFLRGCGFQRT